MNEIIYDGCFKRIDSVWLSMISVRATFWQSYHGWEMGHPLIFHLLKQVPDLLEVSLLEFETTRVN